MRQLLAAALAAAFVSTTVLPATAGEAGSIDHVEHGGGQVQMLFSAPTEAPPDLRSVAVTAAGEPVASARARLVRGGDVRRTVVLALDVSDSMRGVPFAQAKRAAAAYLRAAPDDVRVGLVTFAGHVSSVAAPTTDHEAVTKAIGSLSLSHGTLLYQGILASLGLTGSRGQRDVVVLSDGADTSGTSLEQTVGDVRISRVRVDVIALDQHGSARGRLAAITRASGGVVLSAADPAALTGWFTAEARSLDRQVLVTFPRPTGDEGTVTVSMRAGPVTYTDSTFVAFGTERPPALALDRPAPAPSPGPDLSPLLLVVGAVAMCAGLAAVALVALTRTARSPSMVQRQLDFYAGQRAGQPALGSAPGRPDPREVALSVATRVITRADLETRLRTRLTAAGIALTPAEWLLLHAGVVVVASLVGLLLSRSTPLPFVTLLALSAVGPWVYVRHKEGRRVKTFNAQLADTLQLISGGLSAGLSLPQAVDTVVRDGSEPMSGELRRALIEQRLGVDMEDALDAVGERMASKDFTWVVMAIRIQREVGGNLAELLDTVAGTLREREYLRRQVRSLSAEGRLSAWILGCLPVVLVAYLALVRGEYLDPMLTTPVGWVMSGVAVLMLGVAAFWLSKTVKVEV